MNREILFRGKPLHGGEWVFGDYMRYAGGAWVHDPDGGTYNVLVDRATVGQYTGLTDRNGMEIFEGDLIKYDGRVFEMKYIDGFSAFSLRSVDNMSLAPCITPNTCPRMEVIGNVWDNPEVLE